MNEGGAFLEKLQSEIVRVVEKVEGSVINVSTVKLLQDQYYFDVHPLRGVGSGFLVEDGVGLTNYHVLEGAERVEVAAKGGKRLGGRLLGVDPSTDIAVLKLETSELPSLDLGNSDELKMGQIVFVVGNPLGLFGTPTTTMGVISAVNRTLKTERGVLEGLIQTDAAINPGNSGGPLVDTNGKVIGITTAMIPFAQGIGFAIPINTAKKVVRDILRFGRVRRPWLGVMGVDVTEGLASYYDLPTEKGVIAVQIVPGSPAYESHVQIGDIIVKIDNKTVDGMDELRRCLEESDPGEPVELTLYRNGHVLKARTILKFKTD